MKTINKYYQKYKERLGEEAGKRYQNLSEEKKQKLLEYMKKYYLAHRK